MTRRCHAFGVAVRTTQRCLGHYRRLWTRQRWIGWTFASEEKKPSAFFWGEGNRAEKNKSNKNKSSTFFCSFGGFRRFSLHPVSSSASRRSWLQSPTPRGGGELEVEGSTCPKGVFQKMALPTANIAIKIGPVPKGKFMFQHFSRAMLPNTTQYVYSKEIPFPKHDFWYLWLYVWRNWKETTHV